MFGFDSIGTVINGVLDKFIPDANVREQAKQALASSVMEAYKLDQLDRDSARRREMEVKDLVPRNLAYSYTAGYFAVLAVVVFVGIPVEQQRIFDVLLGVLSGAQMAIMAYYFGASHKHPEVFNAKG